MTDSVSVSHFSEDEDESDEDDSDDSLTVNKKKLKKNLINQVKFVSKEEFLELKEDLLAYKDWTTKVIAERGEILANLQKFSQQHMEDSV